MINWLIDWLTNLHHFILIGLEVICENPSPPPRSLLNHYLKRRSTENMFEKVRPTVFSELEACGKAAFVLSNSSVHASHTPEGNSAFELISLSSLRKSYFEETNKSRITWTVNKVRFALIFTFDARTNHIQNSVYQSFVLCLDTNHLQQEINILLYM